nr:hypothetical protein [Tanacetum cinerariifolium]
MGDHHHKPNTTMVRLWWLLWLQPARSPPQRWRQTTEHNEAPLGVASPQPETTWCGCGAVLSSDCHHDGGLARDRNFSKLHRGGGGQSAIHSPPQQRQRLESHRCCCGAGGGGRFRKAAAVGGGACKMVKGGMVTRVRLPWWRQWGGVVMMELRW